jgi:hypothetical protein
MIESLKEKFGIETLDIKTRTLAGFYLDGKIYIAKTHISALRKYGKEMANAKRATLHIILDKGKRIFFIETNVVLTNVKMETVIEQIKKQYNKPFEAYAYTYKDQIKTLAN